MGASCSSGCGCGDKEKNIQTVHIDASASPAPPAPVQAASRERFGPANDKKDVSIEGRAPQTPSTFETPNKDGSTGEGSGAPE